MKGKAQRGGALAAIGVPVLVVGFLVFGALFYTGWSIARGVRISAAEGKRGKTVDIETPFGSIRMKQLPSNLDAGYFGVPVYPGAVRESDDAGLASFEYDSGRTHRELTVFGAVYTTPDSVEQVREFYRGELPHWTLRDRHGSIQIETGADGQKKIIAIRNRGLRTHIGLASVGGPASN